jgi:hypothetical protein
VIPTSAVVHDMDLHDKVAGELARPLHDRAMAQDQQTSRTIADPQEAEIQFDTTMNMFATHEVNDIPVQTRVYRQVRMVSALIQVLRSLRQWLQRMHVYIR